VARFRAEGVDAAPVVFGDRRHPDAVLLPYETFVLLMDVAEDIVIGERIRERASSDSGRRTSLNDVASVFGIDLDNL
jgi:PHD/YefM family antitoxin component YafN of YafNO toxin-antitoxin module